MRTVPQSALARLLPSLTDVAFLKPLLLIFVSGAGARLLLGDGDTGWHVRTGEWILAHRQVPRADIFSFTMQGHPWYAWEWLWDTLFALLHRTGGMAAVVLASALVISLTAALLYRVVRRACGNGLIAIAVTMLAMLVTSVHWLARPHLFTLLFLVIFYAILERARESMDLPGGPYWRRLAWLPVLTVLWTNLHGGFITGVVLIGLYGAGEAAAAVLLPDAPARAAAWLRCRVYAVTAVAATAASIANPYGWRLHQHILSYVTDSYQKSHVIEFRPFNFLAGNAPYVELMLVAGLGAAFWHLSRKRYIESFVVLAWFHPALTSTRNVPVFAILAAPAIALAAREAAAVLETAAISSWIRNAARRVRTGAAGIDAIESLPRVYLLSALATLTVAGLFFIPVPPRGFRADFDPQAYPAAAVPLLRSFGSSSHIFTIDEWGDYLIYRLYPDGKVFMDGRTDFYGEQFIRNFLVVMNVNPGWDRQLARYRVDTVLVPPEAPIAGALKESSRWRLVYQDGISLVFRPADSARAAATAFRPRSAGPNGAVIEGSRIQKQVTGPSPRQVRRSRQKHDNVSA